MCLSLDVFVAAARIVEKRKHYIKDHRLLVSLLPEEVESCPEDERDADTSMSDQVNDGRGDLPNVGKLLLSFQLVRYNT